MHSNTSVTRVDGYGSRVTSDAGWYALLASSPGARRSGRRASSASELRRRLGANTASVHDPLNHDVAVGEVRHHQEDHYPSPKPPRLPRPYRLDGLTGSDKGTGLPVPPAVGANEGGLVHLERAVSAQLHGRSLSEMSAFQTLKTDALEDHRATVPRPHPRAFQPMPGVRRTCRAGNAFSWLPQQYLCGSCGSRWVLS